MGKKESQKQCKYICKKAGKVTQHPIGEVEGKKAIKISNVSKSQAFLQKGDSFNTTCNRKL